MASASIVREERGGTVRYRVLYRLGGRESKRRHGGSFRTLREARARHAWVLGELAALRVPDLSLLDEAPSVRTLADVADAWRASRVDVAEGTAATHTVNLNRILPRLGDRPVDGIGVADVAALVAELHREGLARESIRKSRSTLAMVLDHAGIEPNPARDTKHVKLHERNQRS